MNVEITTNWKFITNAKPSTKLYKTVKHKTCAINLSASLSGHRQFKFVIGVDYIVFPPISKL